MTLPVRINQGSGSGGYATSQQFTYPTLQANDVLIVGLYKENSDAVTRPANWIELSTPVASPLAVAVSPHWDHVFMLRCSGSETGTYTFSWTGNNWRAADWVLVRGVATNSSWLHQASKRDNGNVNGTDIYSTAVTTTVADCYGIVIASNYTGGTWAVGTGIAAGHVWSGNDDLGMGDFNFATPGDTGTRALRVPAANNSGAWLLLLAPPTSGDVSVQASPATAPALGPPATVVAVSPDVSVQASPASLTVVAPVAASTATAATFTVVNGPTLGPIRGPTGGSNQSHLVYAENTGRWWFFTYGGIVDSGTATGGTTQTLVDSTKNWGASNTLNGKTCHILAGTGAGHVFECYNTNATTLGLVNNGQQLPSIFNLNFTPDATTQYVITDTNHVKAYVSSSADLATATWSLATGGTSPAPENQVGVDLANGRWDTGATCGEYPADGRQLSVAYGNASGHDVVYVGIAIGQHWSKLALRARITGSTTITWDVPGASGGGGGYQWDWNFGNQEAVASAPAAPPFCFNTSNGRWHVLWWPRDLSAVFWNMADPGTGTQYSLNAAWTGVADIDEYTNEGTANNLPFQAALVETASGSMLAVYPDGQGFGSGGGWVEGWAKQVGLRYCKSTSGTAWPTNTGVAIPNLSSTENNSNDWGVVTRTTADVHVVRRNSATVLEHVRYDGNAWGSVTTLPTTGLTGHQAGAGLPMATDGTDVWIFAVDTDAGHSIRYLRWSGASQTWSSSWTTIPSTTNPKTYLIVAPRPGNSQIGVAWTEASGTNFTVVGTSIATAAATVDSSTQATPSSVPVVATTLTQPTQILQPDGDIAIGTFVDELGGTTTLYAHVAEIPASDATYVQSIADPTNQAITFSIFSIAAPASTPASGTLWIRYRYSKFPASPQRLDLKVEILQNAALLFQWDHADISSSWTQTNWQVQISDWVDPLQLRATFNKV